MSLDQFAPIQVIFRPAAPQAPNFGISVIAEELNSQQVSKFLVASGGLSTLRLTPNGWPDTLESLGLSNADLAWIDVAAHFPSSGRAPSEAYLTYRGVADTLHVQTLTLQPDVGTTDRARVGEYRLTNIEGGPYSYLSAGAAQVTDLEIIDVGGGLGATGRYEVSDDDGNLYIYESGGTNVWDFVVTAAAAGLYSLTDTNSGEVYSYTATGADTIETIRDGLLADINDLLAHPAGHPEWITNISGTDTITLTGSAIGLQLAFTSNLGPGGIEATITETTPLVPETVGDIATAIDGVITSPNPLPPEKWTTSVAAGIITSTAKAAFVGQDLGVKIAGPTAPDATTTVTTDHRESLTDVLTALGAALTAGQHPTFINSLAVPVITLTGTTNGVAVVVDVSSPEDSLVLAETQSMLTLRSPQTTRVRILPQSGTDAYLGGYTLSLFGENIMYTAIAGDSITTVRDALQAGVNANLASDVVTLAVGTDAFDITALAGGLPFVTTLTSPSSNAGGTVTVFTQSQGIVDDFERAKDDESDWYIWLDRGTAVDVQALTQHVLDTASDAPRRHFTQQFDPDIPNVPSATATDVAQFVKDTGTGRTSVLWDPVPSSPTADQQGMVHQWAGVASTRLPGQIQWNGVILPTVSGGQKLTAQQEQNLRDKAVTFVEFIGSLGVNGQRVTNGPYTAEGRMIDAVRALDQIKFAYQQGAAALLTGSDIVPFTEQGIAIINDMIEDVTGNLVLQGLVIENSFRYLASSPGLPDGQVPSITDPTADATLGRFPLFRFQLIIQLGGVQIPQVIEVTQG